jgi:hypothetical protein
MRTASQNEAAKNHRIGIEDCPSLWQGRRKARRLFAALSFSAGGSGTHLHLLVI